MARLDYVILIGWKFVPAPGSLSLALSDSRLPSWWKPSALWQRFFGHAVVQFYVPLAEKGVKITCPQSQCVGIQVGGHFGVLIFSSESDLFWLRTVESNQSDTRSGRRLSEAFGYTTRARSIRDPPIFFGAERERSQLSRSWMASSGYCGSAHSIAMSNCWLAPFRCAGKSFLR